MPKMNGIEIAQSLQKLKKRPQVIFTTAHSEFAADAFRVDALDYLLKPYQKEQLDEAINKLRSRLIHTDKRQPPLQSTKLPVEADGEILYIDVSDIVYLYTQGKTTLIFTQNEKNEYKSRF